MRGVRIETGRFPVRRPGEADGALTFRRRYVVGCSMLRGILREFEELRATAEGESSERVDRLKTLLAAVETMQVRLQANPSGDQRRMIGAIRHALEWYRRRREQGKIMHASRQEYADEEAYERAVAAYRQSEIDTLQEVACNLAPELAILSSAAWARAIEDWPGLPASDAEWGRVVHALLSSEKDEGGEAILTGARDYRSLVRTWEP